VQTIKNIKIMKAVVALGLGRLSISKKIEKARFIVASMTGNANFTTPNPSLATITAYVNALEAACIAAQGGRAHDTANMYAKEVVLDLSLKSLGAYVEGIANATPLIAASTILSAGMNVKAKGGKVAHDFGVKVTGNAGEVKLVHLSVKRGSQEFQMTTDPGTEASWARIYCGTRASFVKTGLTSGTRYYFRATAIDKNGQRPWSAVMNMIAL
jgi:hypothetical protein